MSFRLFIQYIKGKKEKSFTQEKRKRDGLYILISTQKEAHSFTYLGLYILQKCRSLKKKRKEKEIEKENGI